MSDINDITQAWEEASRTSEAQAHIHPTGTVDEEAYDESGRVAAEMVWEVMGLYMGAESPRRVADFGCGDGRVLKHLVGALDDLWGIDASPGMLERLGQRVPSVHPLLSTAADGALRGLGADFIFSLAVFIHHSHAGGKAILRGLAEGLAHGGILAVQIPCYQVAHEGNSWIDVTVWDEPSLREAATLAGLQTLEIHTSPGAFSFDAVGENHLRLQVFRKG